MFEPRNHCFVASRAALVTFVALVLLAGPVAAQTPPELRLRGQTHLVEFGLFGGIFIPPNDHELYELQSYHRSLERAAPDIGLRVAYLPWAFLAAEVEAALMPTSTRLQDGSALVYAVRGHLLAQYPAAVAPFVLVGGGILAVASDADVLGNDIDGAVYFGGGAKFYASRNLAVRVDARANIAGRLGPGGREGYYEVLLGISYVLGWADTEKLAVPDTDHDGLPDDRDKCPNEAADTGDGCPLRDTDGDGVLDDLDKCPSEPANTADGCALKDTDGDGIPDTADKCPQVAAQTETGCPDLDSDGDGFADNEDKCPNEAGTHPVGCPPKDTDGDGIKDDRDLCPKEPETVNSYNDEDGCPDQPPAALKRFTGTIPAIQFAVNTAQIRPSSFSTLDEAAKVLKAYADLQLVVRGHSDSSGVATYNKKLSLRRAAAVRDYLVRKGVSPARLAVEGVGPDEPIADNAKASGRAQNRRVEFKIVSSPAKPGSAPATPAGQKTSDIGAVPVGVGAKTQNAAELKDTPSEKRSDSVDDKRGAQENAPEPARTK